MLNVAVIMGRLAADPELRHTPNGVAVTSFTLAVDRSYARAGTERGVAADCRVCLQVLHQGPVDGGYGFHSNSKL